MRRSRLGSARAASLRPAPILHISLAGLLALGAGSLGHHWRTADQTAGLAATTQETIQNSSPAQVLAQVGNSLATAISPKAESVSREAELDDDQTFADLLTDAGAAQTDATAAMNALAKAYDVRHLQAGQNFTLFFSRSSAQETFTGAVFEPEATKEVIVARNAQGLFTATVKAIPIMRQRMAARAEITSSLYEAANRAGIPRAVMASMIRIYSHEIDFQRDIHPGDRFEVLYDQPVSKNGKPVGEGSIIYAAMEVGGKVKPVYRVTFSDNTVDYFDQSGHSVRRTLLRTPVAAAHITSGFGMRMHPILGYSKMHQGVDFGASQGTPIFAAGNGTIDEIGFKGGYGRYIRIRHNGTLSTAYAHMSRFATPMYRGAHVNQGEVIGYVGMSGRATGPHLHFEVHVNGQQVNPMSVNLPTGRILEGRLLAEFKNGQNRIRQEFSTLLAKNGPAAPAAKAATPAAVPAAAIPAKDKVAQAN